MTQAPGSPGPGSPGPDSPGPDSPGPDSPGPGYPGQPHPGAGSPGQPYPGAAYPGYPVYPGGYPAYPGYPAYAAPAPASPSPWPAVAAAAIGVFALAVTAFAQAGGWLADQVLLASGLPMPAAVWPLIGLGNALLVGLPAMLLALVPRSPAVRATGRAWLLGAFALGGFGLLRAIPSAYHELYLLLLAVLAAAGAFGLRVLRRRTDRAAARADHDTTGADRAAAGPGRDRLTALLLAGAAGLVMLLPWLWAGALGGTLETALAVAAAAAVGWYAAELLPPGYWTAIGSSPASSQTGGTAGDAGGGTSAVRTVLLGGTVAGVALALLAAGTGQAGVQLALIAVLPPIGYAVAAILWAAGRSSSGPVAGRTSSAPVAVLASSAPVVVLAAVTMVGPLAFLDAEEVSLLLAMGRDLPFWAAVGGGAGLALAVLLGLVLGFGLGRPRAGWPRRWVATVTVAVVALAGAVVYLTAGQPGLYGERLFVVLREQADLSDVTRATGPEAREARVSAVYQRLVDTAESSQADLRRDLDRWGLSYTPYYLVNAIEVDAGLAVRAWLSRRADVDRVLISQQLRPLPAPVSGSTGDESAPISPQWNITMLGADRVWSQLDVDGSGIVVGSSDSGVDGNHPALSEGFRGGDDSWFDPWNDTRTPADNNGHGTHTLGSAVGTTDIGVAPGASWVGCVNLDRNLGNPARYLDCLQFMLAPFPPGGDPFTDGRPERAPHVLTNSWGCPELEGCDLDSLRPATESLAAAGLMMVAAAGNTGPFCNSVDDPPAPYADVLTVGAVDSDREVTQFSSRGPTPDGEPKPDVVAPGAAVLSAMPGGGYAALDGTSMAAPHVAGVVALMWSANPALIGDVDRTTEILRQTAGQADTGSADTCGDPANLTGAGLVDAYAAVQAAQAAS